MTRTATTAAALLAAAWLAGCGSSPSAPTPRPSPTPDSLPLEPTPVSPRAGEQVATDRPTFTVQNARGFDGGTASYSFEVLTPVQSLEVATATVPAGSRTTSVTLGPLPRGTSLAWRVRAMSGSTQSTSVLTPFRLPPVDCLSTRNPYAKAVVSSYLSACSQERNHYQDPREVLGPPDFGGQGPDSFRGFMSLGEGGYVVVDMEGCAIDSPGNDLRVYQAVGSEPVTLYAGGTPDGPFQLLAAQIRCANRAGGARAGSCDFDLGAAEVQEARYLKVEDGELFPCERGGTVTEGADIDALEILHLR